MVGYILQQNDLQVRSTYTEQTVMYWGDWLRSFWLANAFMRPKNLSVIGRNT